MKQTQAEKIVQQFDILTSDTFDFFIREFIHPVVKNNSRIVTISNEVKQNRDERSLNAQQFFNYCKQYIAFFKSKSYQFLFSDYSLGRFIYEFDEADRLIKYNFYWNPCPFNPSWLEEMIKNKNDVAEFIDNIDMEEEIIELKYISLRTPIRMDFDSTYNGKNKEFHPHYHVHYQNKNTRAKSEKVLSLYGWILFLLENCYPDFYCNSEYEEQIENLRELDKKARTGMVIATPKKDREMGEKIHTAFAFS